MNKLKKYAGLLNDEAPKDHFLAYITGNERDMLVQAGGSGHITKSGIPSFEESWDMSVDYGGSDSSSGSAGDDYGGGDNDPPSNDPPPNDSLNIDHGDDMNYTLEQQRQTQMARNITQGKDPYYNPMLDDIGMEGSITNTTYDPKTKTFQHEQAPGTIKAIEYQKANLKTYLESPDVSDKDKIGILNQLQAIQNSQLVGTAQGKHTGAIDDQDIATDWVLNNLTGSLDYVKGMSNLNKYTSKIDKDSLTFQKQMKNDGVIKTVLKSGGIIGTMFKDLTDSYKNKQAMKLLGYSNKVWNPETGDFGKDGNRMLTGGATEGEREAMTQLAPSAPYYASGTAPQPSQAAKWFANTGSSNNTFSFDFQQGYNIAKAKQASILGNPSAVGWLAVNQSPYYDFLKLNKLDRGIL